jgi:hypothetical protein
MRDFYSEDTNFSLGQDTGYADLKEAMGVPSTILSTFTSTLHFGSTVWF